MLTIKESLEKLKKTKEFKEFIEKNQDAFLYSVFIISDITTVSDAPKQFNYYNKGKVTTFIVSKNIEVAESEGILKEREIKELKLNEINLNLEEALEKAKKIIEENYSSYTLLKIIVTLTYTGFDISYLTSSLKAINIRIDPAGKNIIHQINQILQQPSS
jgi:hypothetical protein